MEIKFPRRRGTPPMRAEAIREMMSRAPEGHSGLKGALDGLARAYEATLAGHARFTGDRTLTPAAQLVRSAKHARAQLGPAMASLAAARQKVHEGRTSLRARMNAPLDYRGKTVSEVMLAAEIRSHFAALPEADRMPAVRAALDGGDLATMTAIAAAPAYLSRISEQLQDHVRNRVVDIFADAAEARDDLAKLEEQADFADRLEGAVMQSAADLVDFLEADSLAAMASEAA